MTPGIDLRIGTMLRAIEQVVSPAIDPENNLAREQLALVTGQLKLLRAQWHKADGYARACRADLSQVIANLHVEGGDEVQSALAVARDAMTADEESQESAYKSAMKAVDALVRAADVDATPDSRSRIHADLLAFSRRQCLRDRSWFALSGFDLKPDELLAIDAIVDGASR